MGVRTGRFQRGAIDGRVSVLMCRQPRHVSGGNPIDWAFHRFPRVCFDMPQRQSGAEGRLRCATAPWLAERGAFRDRLPRDMTSCAAPTSHECIRGEIDDGSQKVAITEARFTDDERLSSPFRNSHSRGDRTAAATVARGDRVWAALVFQRRGETDGKVDSRLGRPASAALLLDPH